MTPGQIFWEAAWPNAHPKVWDEAIDPDYKQRYEVAAQAVIDAHVSAQDDLISLLAGLVREAVGNVKHDSLWTGWTNRAQNALSKVQDTPSDPTPTHDTPPSADAPTGRSGALSRQVGGDHYHQAGIQPWDIIEAYNLDFFEGNALKYLLRRKPGTIRAQDLAKAAHYLERCIERTAER